MKTKSIFSCFKYFLPVIAFGLILTACKNDSASIVEIRGVYGNPKPLWDKGYDLKSLGVNAVFVHSGAVTHEMIKRARAEGAKVFAEFATLNGKNYVDKHPEAWAINDKGEKVKAATWFMGVCPTEPNFRKYRFDQLRKLLSEFNLDGVWMDYVHWHAQFEEPEPILPETCFCNNCLKSFSDDTGINIPDETTPLKAKWILENKDVFWRKWRSRVILEWVSEFKGIVNELRPEALLGLYHCPWNDQEFDSARYRILGLDYDLLKETVDVFSPMVYHKRMGRRPEWVSENISWFNRHLGIQKNKFPKVWPIVQAADIPGEVTAEELETVMRGGLTSNSSGVMMFTTYSLAKSDDKMEVIKKVYMEFQNKRPE